MSLNGMDDSASETARGQGVGGRETTARRNGNGTRAATRVGSATAAEVEKEVDPAEVTLAMVEAARVALLAEKQGVLDAIVDRHDDKVRELFHMENFKNMLLYDPKVAKEDRTVVFREYKAKYDLVDNAAPIAGPSRQTRGRTNERRQILKTTAISAPIPSTAPKRKPKIKNADRPDIENILISAARSYRGKGKQKEVIPEAEPPAPTATAVAEQTLTDVQSISTPAVEESEAVIVVRRKPERQSQVPSPLTPRVLAQSVLPPPVPLAPEIVASESISMRRITQKKIKSIPGPRTPNLKKRPAPVPIETLELTEKLGPNATTNVALECPETILDPQSAAPLSPPERHQELPPPATESAEPEPAEPEPTEPEPEPAEPEPAEPEPAEPEPVESAITKAAPSPKPPTLKPPVKTTATEPISSGLTRRSGRLKEPPQPEAPPKSTVKLKIRPSFPEIPSTQPTAPVPEPPPVASPPKLSIKRIKLIVRRPPPTLTNPRQRPPPAKFNNSLSKFLNSYISLDDNQPDADPEKLAKEAKAEAVIRERIQRFHDDGRFIPGTDALFGTIPSDVPYVPPKRTTRDLWDEVVQAAVAKAKARPKKPLGRVIAAQVAAKVQAHFGAKESKKTKAKDAEERRLRNLAKSTMKLVIAEWKKAVYHIREKQRLALEAEERRAGRAHLASILDQSGHILETQQGDLSRGDLYGSRSRSGSIGDFEDDEADMDEDDEEEEDVEDDDMERRSSKSARSGTEGAGSDEEEGGQEDEEDEEDNDDEATSLLLMGDRPTRSHSSPTARSGTSASTPAASTPAAEDDPEVSTAQLLNVPVKSSALGDLMMYADSDSDSDLDLGGLQANISPDKSPVKVNGHQDQEDDYAVERNSQSRSASPVTLKVAPSAHTRSQSREVRFDSPTHIADDNSGEAVNVPAEPYQEEAQESIRDNVDAEEAEQEEEGGQEDEKEGELEEEGEGKGVTEAPVDVDPEAQIPEYLKPYAVAPVEWDPDAKVTPPLLLRGVLRPYQQSGLEWLASLHVNKLNGILADEMGLGKTIQTISLLAHLACDRGIWGPHLIIVPTSVLLNWEMEFKKFLPGFRVLSYHGSTKRRKELRQGWNDKHHFNVCITSYTLASRDAHIFKRKPWYYMILDEAHMIKNFRSQRWNILLMFRSYRRLLLTGTPLQNNLTELWALLQFLMSGANFANLKEFGEWFSNPLEKAIELGNALDDDTMQTVSKLHTVLRPYLLRRLKRDVEKELPSKYEHLMLCPLSKRQRFLYDEFMSRAQTRDALDSGVYQKIANILMQLRKVCNHPDLFEVRPIVTSFAMSRSAIADYEIKELLVRRRLLSDDDESVDLKVVGLNFIDRQNISLLSAVETRRLDATPLITRCSELGDPPPNDTRTIDGYLKHTAYMKRASLVARRAHIGYLNKLRCSRIPIYSEECLSVVRRMTTSILPFSNVDIRKNYLERVDRVHLAVKSYAQRADDMAPLIDQFAFVTPPVIAMDIPRIALSGYEDPIVHQPLDFDSVLHRTAVKLQIAFPDPSLLQWDCGKLQKLAELLRERKSGGHRVLIFTQMTRILDILEIFLNFHGYLYLRLDGATKIEDRQYITERFNADNRIFCFIASSRSGGVGINLTGADTVVFYDSDFNPQMDRQCEDRAHRIGQIRDVHIYRFVSQHTVEEAMLRKANQKRSLDELVIQKGEFDWRSLFNEDETALTKALGDFEDAEDRHAAAVAAREEFSLVGQDEADFADVEATTGTTAARRGTSTPAEAETGAGFDDVADVEMAGPEAEEGEDEDDQGGSVVEYMLKFIEEDYEYFRDWRL
ncbi:hypothetical protein BDN70DRAFT_878844 [Pholiota conissans]|uniref:Helicase SWR1 n=1 Tax=Pholiota conissans TaxID=109636 RepID=A0A9P5Z1A0_9AGAR|nr:hypothetical protein BDN70DRAFT_878844 [Pholiota conissans]